MMLFMPVGNSNVALQIGAWGASLGMLAGVIAGTVVLSHHPDPAPVRIAPATMAVNVAQQEDLLDQVSLDNFATYPGGSQISLLRLSDGHRIGSATDKFPRPALSLAKLYIADYVLAQGDDTDRELVMEMIKRSDDAAADKLTEKYPTAIAQTAAKYGLRSTKLGESWGKSETSTYDAVTFLATKIKEDPNSELLNAMRESEPVASDGYPQDFGTSVLPGARGSKWGWSNDKSLHSSITFGDDYVVAAAVMGSAEDLTQLVKSRVEPQLAG